ncbi:MAG TPA: hypothetical protein VM493_02555 [Vicinamibacterales bacterium]|nr:hypothetical protein [Vicinamibacterales bacterium]
MKVDSAYRYMLPCNVTLEKGVSEVGELPAAAKKHLDKLIAAGIVKVLDAPKEATPTPPAAPAAKPEQANLLGEVQSVVVKAQSASADESAKLTAPTPKTVSQSRDSDPVDVRAKTSRRKADES